MAKPIYKFFNVFALCHECKKTDTNDITYFRNIGTSGKCCSCLENTGTYLETVRIPVIDGNNDFRFQIIIKDFPSEIFEYWGVF